MNIKERIIYLINTYEYGKQTYLDDYDASLA